MSALKKGGLPIPSAEADGIGFIEGLLQAFFQIGEQKFAVQIVGIIPIEVDDNKHTAWILLLWNDWRIGRKMVVFLTILFECTEVKFILNRRWQAQLHKLIEFQRYGDDPGFVY